MSERTVKDLVDRVKRRCAFLNPRNPERVLFEECVEALVDVSVQLAQAKTVEKLKARSSDDQWGIPKPPCSALQRTGEHAYQWIDDADRSSYRCSECGTGIGIIRKNRVTWTERAAEEQHGEEEATDPTATA